MGVSVKRTGVDGTFRTVVAMTDAAAPLDAHPSTTEIYEAHHEFVWLTLQRFGVPRREVEDAAQEVFVVVHRRLPSFAGSFKLTTWLYGICRRVAAGHLRRAFRTREVHNDSLDQREGGQESDPEHEMSRRQARGMLEEALRTLNLDHRVVLVMYELEGHSCHAIAEELGIPVGTVHSRLHKARAKFRKAVERLRQGTRR